MTKQYPVALKNQLEETYRLYNRIEYLDLDPLGMISPSLNPYDFEIYSLIAAGLAYGRVEQCRKSIKALLEALQPLGVTSNGEGFKTLIHKNFSKSDLQRSLKNWKHRLNTGNDIVELFENIHHIYKTNKSLAELFQNSYKDAPKEHLIEFCNHLAPMKERKKNKGTGASWFAASPERGSSCKRFLLWLKWMIRKDEIDPGIWQNESLLNKKLDRPMPSRLFMPVDTHIHQWASQHRVTKSRNISWKMTEEITAYFSEICPEDPLRYDFAICHQGMVNYRTQ